MVSRKQWFFIGESIWVAGSIATELKDRVSSFQEAWLEAQAMQKPLANIGCGSYGNIANTLTPDFLSKSDFNVDFIPREVPNFILGNIYNLPFTDKQLGVAWASHVLEHLDDPDAAIAELQRVSDVQFMLVPDWWSPTSYLPSHRWIFTSDTFTKVSNRPTSAFALLGMLNIAALLA